MTQATQFNLDADTALLIGIAVSILFSFLSVVLSLLANRSAAKAVHASQVAQFRQEWINRLRDDLAQFHAIGVTPEHEPHLDMEFYRIGTRIELMINPDDEDYQIMQDLLYGYLTTSEAGIAEKYSNNPEFIEVSQRILKREWERLKQDIRKQRI